MSKFESTLNNIKIASPCPANWDEMYGNERKRYCGDCKLNVYNISGMTSREAEDLITNSEGRLCVRLYRRADGSVLTQNCPVGWAKVRQRTQIFATAVLSLILSLFSGLLFVSMFSKNKKEIGRRFPIPFVTPTPEQPTMGVMAMPTPTPRQKPTPKPSPKDDEIIMGEVAYPDKDQKRETLMGKVVQSKN